MLDDKVALVTGAARGQGEGIARRFADEGAAVVCADLLDATAVADSLTASPSGSRSRAVFLDVTDAKAVEEVVASTVADYGKLDILHNNAGVNQPVVDVVDTADEVYDRVLAVNLWGVIACSRAAGAVMRGQRSGRIINTSSQLGKVAFPGWGVYSASKAGVILITQTMALELAPFGVTVNCICPGAMDTPMIRSSLTAAAQEAGRDVEEIVQEYARSIPVGRLGTPRDVGALAAWLASDDASFMTGAALNLTGGEQVFF